MNLEFFFFIFGAIICSNESSYVFKKLDNNTFNLEINDSEKEVYVSLNSEDYLVLDGFWYFGEDCVFTDQFEIYGVRMSDYIQKNIISMDYLNRFLSNLNARVFAFKTEKIIFRERTKKNTFECKFKLFNKEDIRSIMTDYVRKVSLLDYSDEDTIRLAFDYLYEELQRHGTTYGIRFNKNNGEMPNFFEYELGVYKKAEVSKRERQSSFFEAIKSFKEPAIAVAKHTFVSVAIFGPYGLILAYLMGKYLIKR